MPKVNSKHTNSSNGHTTLSNALKELTERQFRGTDDIVIGSDIPLFRDPLFAWMLQRLIGGESVDDATWSLLPPKSRKLLEPVRRKPTQASVVVERFQGQLSDAEQEAFASLLLSMKDAPNPVATLSMADIAKVVDGTKWLWKGWIPFGMLTQVFAEPGKGKSAFVLGGPVKSIITGGPWPDGKQGSGKPGYVLWCDTEGSAAITIDRIKKWGLPPQRILTPFQDDPYRVLSLKDPSHLYRLESLINYHKIPLVVVDSMRSAHGEDENSSRVASVLQGLLSVVNNTNAAGAVIHHSKKISEEQELNANSSRGSNAIQALFRSQIGIDWPDPKSKQGRIRELKNQFGQNVPPLGFRFLENDKGMEFGPAPEQPHRTSEKDRAVKFLLEEMKPDEWMKSQPLIDDAKQQSISENALFRARADLGIIKDDKARYVKKDNGVWWWRLPTQEFK